MIITTEKFKPTLKPTRKVKIPTSVKRHPLYPDQRSQLLDSDIDFSKPDDEQYNTNYEECNYNTEKNAHAEQTYELNVLRLIPNSSNNLEENEVQMNHETTDQGEAQTPTLNNQEQNI